MMQEANSPHEQLRNALLKPIEYLKVTGFKNETAINSFFFHVQNWCEKLANVEALKLSIEHIRRILETLDASVETKKNAVLAIEVLLQGDALPHPQTHLNDALDFKQYFFPEDHPDLKIETLKKKYGSLNQPVKFIKGVGPAIAAKFEKKGIYTVRDLLTFFPRRYEDRRNILKISALQSQVSGVVLGEIQFAGVTYYRGLKKRVYEIELVDDTGAIRLKWFRFNQKVMTEKYKKGQHLCVFGVPREYRSKMEMHHPEVEIYAGTIDLASFGGLVSVYPDIEGLHQKSLRKIIHTALNQHVSHFMCILPPELCEKEKLNTPYKSLVTLHQPRLPLTDEERYIHSRGFIFTELFFYCLSLLLQKQKNKTAAGIRFDRASALVSTYLAQLSFELTQVQRKAIDAIAEDMTSEFQMNRLLQGDVGSGKTLVAITAALRAVENKYQVAFIAPTEILAQQHFENHAPVLEKLGVKSCFISGKQKLGLRRTVLEEIEKNAAQIVFGTHAMIEDTVAFKQLGLVIVDEQHRFGVKQREKLYAKGIRPDILTMSATPIPRTLALTLYGDLDVSIMDELPKGREKISTWLRNESQRDDIHAHVRRRVEEGRQVFIIYPLVEASEKIDLKDAVGMAEKYQNEIFSAYRVGLIHGKMNSESKEQIMTEFSSGKLDILVSTTVIEVGINVPNASVMIIEHPDRFGLSQLHQLRGRVGRGSYASECILIMPPDVSALAKARLNIFQRLSDGFLLAEEDLKLRGPGDFFGVAQSGFPQFSFAQFPRDLTSLEIVRRFVSALLDANELPYDQAFLEDLSQIYWQNRIEWHRVS